MAKPYKDVLVTKLTHDNLASMYLCVFPKLANS